MRLQSGNRWLACLKKAVDAAIIGAGSAAAKVIRRTVSSRRQWAGSIAPPGPATDISASLTRYAASLAAALDSRAKAWPGSRLPASDEVDRNAGTPAGVRGEPTLGFHGVDDA